MTDVSPSVYQRAGEQPLWNNLITMFGLSAAVVGLVLMITFWVFNIVTPPTNPYVDIIGFLILPTIMGAGLVIAPIGVLLKRRKLRLLGVPHPAVFRLPRIDLNDPRQRNMILAFIALNVFIILPAVAVSSYHGYHYTDSTEFCAKACHAVMKPQGLSHANSPHARVACAECHIGEGAGSFFKAKLSGTRQLIAVWSDSFHRPISPAITSLRPARETCEECHWPEKFFGSQLQTRIHYSSDENNTRREVKMLVKTGGHDPATGRAEGIHLHMAIGKQLEYVATDDELQNIPWVKMTDDRGVATIYRSDGLSADAPPPEGIARRLDCLDCHNRAAHRFRPPQEAVDLLLETGQIHADLPYIKREAVTALTQSYANVETAFSEIERKLIDYYRVEHPGVWQSRQADVTVSVNAAKEIYGRNFFPAMRVDWKSYPDNIGHQYSAGCFRCHDGMHVNDRGESIMSDCKICHTFLNTVDAATGAMVEGEFVHSMSMVLHDKLRCTQCHTGGTMPLCRDCHASGTWLDNRQLVEFQPAR